MRPAKLTHLIPLVVALGCSSAQQASTFSGAPSDQTSSGDDAQRVISEADIIQLDGGLLYAMSKSGTVSIIDVSQPGKLTLLGQTTLPGQPFEMYLRGDFLVTMSNAAVSTTGTYGTTQTVDEGAGALVIALDVSDSTHPVTAASLPVPGEIADSRVVGDVLYLATYQNAQCYGCGTVPLTMVTTFNIASPAAITQVEQVSYQSNAPDGYNLPWGQNWKRSIFVTDQRLYIGGHADINPNDFGTVNEGIIDVLDITDPTGRLGVGARLSVAGAILSRWQLDETGGVLRVISQLGAGRTGNGLAPPTIDTFTVASAQSFTPLGEATMTLPRQEGLRTVRFDGPRAYAITYNQTDPMFVIDLSNPAQPAEIGALSMPGFMYYLEPHGDRVIGLGIDRNDPNGSLNVSLFDVSDGANPRMLARAAFATVGITEDYEILDSEVSEDQDRIQKAFRVFPDGLVVVPFTALQPYYASDPTCVNTGGGVQLISWQSDTLTKHALLPLPGNPRRGFENNGELLAVSDSNVRAFALDNLDVSHETADLVIGTCTSSSSGGTYVVNAADYREGTPLACAVAPGGGHGSAAFALLGLAAIAVVRRRRTTAHQGRGAAARARR